MFKWTQWIDGIYYLEYKNIKKRIIDKLSDVSLFTERTKYLTVQRSNINWSKYVLAILKGKDQNIVI